MCARMCVLDLVPKEAHPKEMQSVYPSPPKAFDVHSGVKFTEHQAHWEGDLLSWGLEAYCAWEMPGVGDCSHPNKGSRRPFFLKVCPGTPCFTLTREDTFCMGMLHVGLDSLLQIKAQIFTWVQQWSVNLALCFY